MTNYYLTHSTCDRYIRGVGNFLGSVSSQQKLEAMDVKTLSMSQLSDHVIALGQIVLQLHVTAQFYLENKRKIHHWGVRACWPKRHEENRERACVCACTRVRGRKRETPQPFGSSFYMFFLPLGLPYINWARQECCLFCLRSSLQSSDLPLFYFCGLFPSLSFGHQRFGLLCPILTT